MEFINKRTIDLTVTEKEQICDLFQEVFKKEKKVIDFERQFLNTYKGYSYHSLMYENEQIVGINSVIPYEYMMNGKKTQIVLSVDTMTKEEFRSLKSFLKMARDVYKMAKEDGIVFVLGFPNDISYKIFKKMLRWQDITKLDFYILPLRVGNIKKSFSFFNMFSLLYSQLVSKLSYIFKNSTLQEKSIEKCIDEKFLEQRYDSESIQVKEDGFDFVYKLDSFDETPIAYLVDVYPLSKSNLQKSVNFIFNKHYNDIDAILYVGLLDFTPVNMLKVPQKFQPKNVYMSGLVLDETLDFEVFNKDNWNVNLSNFDVV